MATAAALRVVSLVPSVSETLRAWGIEPVAVTLELDSLLAAPPDLILAPNNP